MPELPDLEVFSHNLTKLFKGAKLEGIEAPGAKKLNVSKAELKRRLVGQSLKLVERNGKELFFNFSGENVLGIHLMLHGGLHLFEKANDHKHTILAMSFDNGQGLALTDWQGAAVVSLNPEPKDAPDALATPITYTVLKKMLDNRRAIKTLLLDQKVIRGIGNAYADEILWDAGISPFSIGNKIPDEYVKKLAHSIKSVLKDAEKQIRKKDPDIISGEVRDFLKIHNARKDKSPTGGKILTKTAGGRKTYYTEEQELFK